MISPILDERVRHLVEHIRAGGEVAITGRIDGRNNEQFFLETIERPHDVPVHFAVLEIGLPVVDVIAPPTNGSRN